MPKLNSLLLGLLLLPLGLIGCDGRTNPLTPTPTFARNDGPKAVAYRATASFVPGSPALTLCDLPPGYSGEPVALPSLLVATGEHTHMGRTTSEITIDYCAVTATGVLGGGDFAHTGGNGDSFQGRWDALFTPPTFAFVENGKGYPIVAEEGTGRFEGISGQAYGTGTIDPLTGAGTFSVRGEITSPGSSK